MGNEVNWDDYKDESFDDGSYSADAATTAGARERQPVNYLVDLGTRKILGTTGCTHFGTRSRYNHITCSVVWSPDCATFVQVTSDKWSYNECRVGRIADAPKLVGTADLGEAAEISADAFLTARKRPKHEDDGSIDLAVGKVTNDGTIHLRLWSQSPSVPNKGEVYYELDEQFRLHNTPKGLRLERLKVRYAPKE